MPIDGELSLAESPSDDRPLSFHKLSTGKVCVIYVDGKRVWVTKLELMRIHTAENQQIETDMSQFSCRMSHTE